MDPVYLITCSSKWETRYNMNTTKWNKRLYDRKCEQIWRDYCPQIFSDHKTALATYTSIIFSLLILESMYKTFNNIKTQIKLL